MDEFREIHYNYKTYKSKEVNIKALYKRIKEEYIKDKNLNITLERIYLERKLENYMGETLSMYWQIFITVMTTLITVSLTLFLERTENTVLSTISLVIALPILIYVYISIFNKKHIKVERNQYLYYKICLEVLKEIENNKKSSNEKVGVK